jgi:hypothetical protein
MICNLYMHNLRICRDISLHRRDGRWCGGGIYDNDGIRDCENVYNSDRIHDLGQKLCINQCQVSLGGPNMLTAEDKHDRLS